MYSYTLCYVMLTCYNFKIPKISFKYIKRQIVLLFDHCAEGEGEEHVEEHQNNHPYGRSNQNILIVLDLILHGCVASLKVVIDTWRRTITFATFRNLSVVQSIAISAYLTATLRFVDLTVEIKMRRIPGPVGDIVDTTAFQLFLHLVPNSF